MTIHEFIQDVYDFSEIRAGALDKKRAFKIMNKPFMYAFIKNYLAETEDVSDEMFKQKFESTNRSQLISEGIYKC
jgi:hypothetical protein